MKNKKGNVAIIAVIIVIVAITASVITWLVVTKTQTPVQQQVVTQPVVQTPATQQADETANWQTYDSKFGYTFKYPGQKTSVKSKYGVANNSDKQFFDFHAVDKSKMGTSENGDSFGGIYGGKVSTSDANLYPPLSKYESDLKNAVGYVALSDLNSTDGAITWKCQNTSSINGGKYKDCATQVGNYFYDVSYQIDSKNYFTDEDFDNIVKSFKLTK